MDSASSAPNPRRRNPKRVSAAQSAPQPASAADTTSGDDLIRTSGAPEETGDPSYDDIARRAYERYLSRGGSHGQDFDDWVEAERELRSRR